MKKLLVTVHLCLISLMALTAYAQQMSLMRAAAIMKNKVYSCTEWYVEDNDTVEGYTVVYNKSGNPMLEYNHMRILPYQIDNERYSRYLCDHGSWSFVTEYYYDTAENLVKTCAFNFTLNHTSLWERIFAYDLEGNLKEERNDRSDVPVFHFYDSLGKIVETQRGTGNNLEQDFYHYDDNDSLVAIYRYEGFVLKDSITKVYCVSEDEIEMLQRSFNNDGLLIREVSVVFDVSGNVLRVTYDNCRTYSFYYDENHLLDSLLIDKDLVLFTYESYE